LFRATDGGYPKRFRQKLLYLTPDGMVIRSPVWMSLRRRAFQISEDVLDAHIRPYNFKTDYNVKGAGIHAKGQPFDWAGFEIITCRTSRGLIEFAIPRPDVPTALHYLGGIKGKEPVSDPGRESAG
jgi:hypothetical protein